MLFRKFYVKIQNQITIETLHVMRLCLQLHDNDFNHLMYKLHYRICNVHVSMQF